MMKKTLKRLLTGALTLATVITAIPSTAVHASDKQYWTESTERVGHIDDDIIVVLPAEAGEKHFQPEQKVKLMNPRITAEGYKIGNRGFTNYILLADDMLPAEHK